MCILRMSGLNPRPPSVCRTACPQVSARAACRRTWSSSWMPQPAYGTPTSGRCWPSYRTSSTTSTSDPTRYPRNPFALSVSACLSVSVFLCLSVSVYLSVSVSLCLWRLFIMLIKMYRPSLSLNTLRILYPTLFIKRIATPLLPELCLQQHIHNPTVISQYSLYQMENVFPLIKMHFHVVVVLVGFFF